MKIKLTIILILLMSIGVGKSVAQNTSDNMGSITWKVVIDGDTMPYFELPTYLCYPPLKFKNKRQEKFYWRTVRDVKRVIPLCKYIRAIIEKTNNELMKLPDKKARNTYMKRLEKQIYNENEALFKQLTLNQGKLLIRLIERETSFTSYELIKSYRGSFTAGFWQIFALVVGGDLKSRYGSKEEDDIVERIIKLVEAGQL